MVFVTKFRVVNYRSRLGSIVESIIYIKEKYAIFKFNVNGIYNIHITILILKIKYY